MILDKIIKRRLKDLALYPCVKLIGAHYTYEIETMVELCRFAIQKGWKAPLGLRFPSKINEKTFTDYYGQAIAHYDLECNIVKNMPLIKQIALGVINPSDTPVHILLEEAKIRDQKSALKVVLQRNPDAKHFKKFFLPAYGEFLEDHHTLTMLNTFLTRQPEMVDEPINTPEEFEEMSKRMCMCGKEGITYSGLRSACNYDANYIKNKFNHILFEYHTSLTSSMAMEDWFCLEAAFYGQLAKTAAEIVFEFRDTTDNKYDQLFKKLLKHSFLLNEDDLYNSEIDSIDGKKHLKKLKNKHTKTGLNFLEKLMKEKHAKRKEISVVNRLIAGSYKEYKWHDGPVAFWPCPPNK
ncbi:MAG: hypothetical protein JNL74_09100 [Fibrobacteres bacterium]|nr:hypothetical protein [Fibrobacterota bacterium]